MAVVLSWKVLRRHEGDRMYEEGDIREGTEADLGHLSPNVLRKIGADEAAPAPKAESDPVNKSQSAPMNKAEPAPVNKASKKSRKGSK